MDPGKEAGKRDEGADGGGGGGAEATAGTPWAFVPALLPKGILSPFHVCPDLKADSPQENCSHRRLQEGSVPSKGTEGWESMDGHSGVSWLGLKPQLFHVQALQG